jgi:hypothetical protein
MIGENGNGTQPLISMTEAPYSGNFRAASASGYEIQFTVRAVSEEGFLTRLNHLCKMLEDNHFHPLLRQHQQREQPPASRRRRLPPSRAVRPAGRRVPSPSRDRTGRVTASTRPRPCSRRRTPKQRAAEEAKRVPICPTCGSECWDNRGEVQPGQRRPLIKCKNVECDYRVWPAKPKQKGGNR